MNLLNIVCKECSDEKVKMAARADMSEFESPAKKKKCSVSDKDDSVFSSENNFGDLSENSDSQFDACEGVSTDSGYNEVSQQKTEIMNNNESPSHSCDDVPNTDECNLRDRIFALRSIMREELWRRFAMQLFAPPARQRLSHISRFSDVIRLIKESKRIMVLTGAGVSVSCGIPDFRSRDGIYARLAQDFPDLPDPHAMFDCAYFKHDPRPFFKFAKEIYPGRFTPSPSHRFIKALEAHGKLLNNYTQNIDTLERAAGISRVIECHGSFAKATCTKCKRTVSADQIRDDVFAQRIPMCEICNPGVSSVSANDDTVDYANLVAQGVMKPNIVFFGEGLPMKFHECVESDRSTCDLLLVIGSSLKVRPVAQVPLMLPPHVPQVLINRERLTHFNFDVELLGDSDVIINQICQRLGSSWLDDAVSGSDGDSSSKPLLERAKNLILPPEYSMLMPLPQTSTCLSDDSPPVSPLDKNRMVPSTSLIDENSTHNYNDFDELETMKDTQSQQVATPLTSDQCVLTSVSDDENNDENSKSSLFGDISEMHLQKRQTRFVDDNALVSELLFSSQLHQLTAVDTASVTSDTTASMFENMSTTTETTNSSPCHVSSPMCSTSTSSASPLRVTNCESNKQDDVFTHPCKKRKSDDFEDEEMMSADSDGTARKRKLGEQSESDNVLIRLGASQVSGNKSEISGNYSTYSKNRRHNAISSDSYNNSCENSRDFDTEFMESGNNDQTAIVNDVNMTDAYVNCSTSNVNEPNNVDEVDDDVDEEEDNEDDDDDSSSSSESESSTEDENENEENNGDEDDDDEWDFDELKLSLADCLPPNTFYYRPPNRYIFPGAEVRLKRKYLNCFVKKA